MEKIGEEIMLVLVHVDTISQWLRSIKETQAYVRPYTSEKKNTCANICLLSVCTDGYSGESTQSFMQAASGSGAPALQEPQVLLMQPHTAHTRKL